VKYLSFSFVTLLSALVPSLISPQELCAQGQLETPQSESFQSGIGLVRGWVCRANRVDIEVVGRGTLPAVYGELRGDTQSACGGKADNGFSLLVNWNPLGNGVYTVRALADGVPFGSATFTVATLGQEFLRGVSGQFVLPNFPQPGFNVTVRWDKSLQNFVIEKMEQGVSLPPPPPPP
jgi:lysyl endopeptidase